MIPFSRGSGIFDSLVRPLTPLIGLVWSYGTLGLMASSFSLRGSFIGENGFVLDLQLGHTGSPVARPHLEHVLKRWVSSPQISQWAVSLLSLQDWQTKFTTSTSMIPALAAVRTSLDAPPSFPTGNSAWTGGFRRLVMAFSGLPTLMPMVVV